MNEKTNVPAKVPAKAPAKTPAAVVQLAPKLQQKLDDCKGKILTLVRRTMEQMAEIGKLLVEARGCFTREDKAQWVAWLGEVGLKESTASKFMTVGKAFSKLFEDGVDRAHLPDIGNLGLREAYFVSRKVLDAPTKEKAAEVIKQSITGKKINERVKIAARERRREEKKSGKATPGVKVTHADYNTELGKLDISIRVFEDLADEIAANLSVTNRTAMVEGLVKIQTRIGVLIKKIRPVKTITIKANKPAPKPAPKPDEKKEPAEDKKPETADAA